MFDVFYYGPKPGIFEFEQSADSIEDAAKKSKTRFCWYIYGGNDYTGFNFDFSPLPWEKDYTQVFPSQWQKDGGVYLINPLTAKNKEWLFCDQPVRRVSDHENWAIPDHIDPTSVDLSWHPNPFDPPYIYHFPSQHQSSSGVTYTVPGATEIKLVNDFCVVSTGGSDNWQVPNNIDESTIDFTWHPNPLDPPYIYHFPSQYQSASGVTYTVPGATEVKIADDFQVISKRSIDRWTVPDNIDQDSVDFTWHANPLDPPYIYHFPSQHQSASGVVYTVPGAAEIKLVDDFVVKATVDRANWVVPNDIDDSTVDFTWHPDALEPAYVYHFPSRYQASSGVTYAVPGAAKIKLVDDFVVEAKSDMVNWHVPGYIDIKTVDFSWKPNALDDAYIYHFPSQHQASSGVTYTVPGATEIKLVDDFQVVSVESAEHWTVPDNIDPSTVDKSWHPDALEPAYIYHFPSQHQAASGVTYTMESATQTKIIDAFVVRSLENKSRWTVPDEIDPVTVDFSWHPDALEPPYVYHFPSEWQASSGLEYHQPGATEIKIADEFPHHVAYVGKKVSKVLDIFFVDHYNNQSASRWERLLARYPHAQKIRFANTEIDTIRRCCNRSTTNRFWVVSSECIYDDFDFAWHPESWQRFMTHVFGSQWQKWSATYLINRSEFERNTKWAKSLEEFPNLNFVRDQPVVIPDDLYDIYYVDHGNSESQPQLTRLREDHPKIKTTRFVDNYLDTLKRIMGSAETEYVWVVSSICDYSVFDFSWQPEPWQAEMIHVFPSNSERRGDTFYIHVESFKKQMADLEILDWFNVINYTNEQWVQRFPMPTVTYDGDSLVDVVRDHDFGSDIYVKFCYSKNGDIDYTPCIWRAKDRAIHSLSVNNATALVPRDVKQYPLVQMYDYPEIDKTKRTMLLGRPLDVVFISNGETDAERWYKHLEDTLFDKYLGEITAKRVMNVDGRTRAYQAAAEASETDWFFAVFAKLEVEPTFDWFWQPDYFQEAKHYIFNARNPVNGLEYGHMGVIAYNRRLVLETTDPGLDFTLSRAHEVVPALSATAHFNSDPWMTWRTAFREVLKLRHYYETNPTLETEHRLETWCNKAEGLNAEWSLRGANDAVGYYKEVNGRMPDLMKSFDWDWLRQRFKK